MPIIQLYIKPSTIGLCLANQTDRDLLWAQLGNQQNCAERFGERTIRFHPDKATASFNIALEAEMKGVFVDKPKAEPKLADLPKVMKPLPSDVMVVPTAPAPIEPVAIIPTTVVETGPLAFGEQLIKTVTKMEIVQQLEPPAMIEMPQIGSVNVLPDVAGNLIASPALKPPDLRSRAGREWKAQQEQIAKQQQIK